MENRVIALPGLATWSSFLLLALLSLLLLGFFLQAELSLTGGRLGVPLDDAWIHYQFARNLSQGHGFSYNPGQPTPGSTAPLWTLLLAVVGFFSAEAQTFLIASILLSAAFFLATVWLGYGFTLSLTGSKIAALLAGLGVALAGRFLWAGLAGMETTAFAALSLAAVWLYTRQGLRPAPALLFGLASQLRPEGHALFALALLLQIADCGLRSPFRNPQSAIRNYLLPLVIYGLTAAPYALFSLSVTGKLLPNTFYAKVGTEHFFSWRTLRETIMLHWYDNPVSLLLVPLGLWPVWRSSRLATLWLLGLPLLTALVVDFTWHHGRYTMPLIPFQMVVAAVGAHWLIQKLETGSRLRMPGLHASVSPPAVLLALLIILAGCWQLPAWARMLGHNASEILAIDVALGHWLAENTPPDALLAVDDIGAITFLSQRRIIDLNGLVSPEMWPALQEKWGLPRNRAATRILSELQPEYLVVFPLWHWEVVINADVAEPVYRVQTATHTIIAEQEAVVYRATWPYLDEAAPLVRREVTLDGVIQLLGYDLQLQTDQGILLTLYWHSLALVSADYDVFVHLMNGAGEIVAQVDQQPLQGLAATNLWQPGDVVRDPYQLALPADLSPGEYTLRVGMYQRDSGLRLSVVAPDVVNDSIYLTTIDLSS